MVVAIDMLCKCKLGLICIAAVLKTSAISARCYNSFGVVCTNILQYSEKKRIAFVGYIIFIVKLSDRKYVFLRHPIEGKTASQLSHLTKNLCN